MIPLPRRGGGGVEWGGDACIALGGQYSPFTPDWCSNHLRGSADFGGKGIGKGSIPKTFLIGYGDTYYVVAIDCLQAPCIGGIFPTYPERRREPSRQ
jgi:hypothetical protein